MDAYRWRYLALWLGALALLGTGLVLLPWGVFSLVSHDSPFHAKGNHPERGAVFVTFGTLALVTFLYMRLPSQQLSYRAGMDLCSGLFGRAADQAPPTLQRLRAATQSFKQGGVQPTVVGGAWSNVLRHRSTYGPRLFTRNLTGQVPGGDGMVWYAGTEVMDVNKELKKEGLQLISVPSYGCVTMGAWVATMGHGMTSAGAAHGLISVSARVMDLRTGVETDDSPEMLLDKFGKGPEKAARHLVLTVSIKGSPTLVQDRTCLREGRWVRTVADAAWALQKDALMMVLFVGRRETLCLRWTPQALDAPRVNGGGALMDVGIALFGTLGRGLSNPQGEGRDRSEKLSAGVLLFHFYLQPIFIWFYLLLNITNFEVYTTDLEITPALVLSLTTALQPVHRKHGGRTELRVLGKLLFMDCFAYGRAGQRAMLATLSAQGVGRVALHPGKFAVRPDDVANAGLELVGSHAVARA